MEKRNTIYLLRYKMALDTKIFCEKRLYTTNIAYSKQYWEISLKIHNLKSLSI